MLGMCPNFGWIEVNLRQEINKALVWYSGNNKKKASGTAQAPSTLGLGHSPCPPLLDSFARHKCQAHNDTGACAPDLVMVATPQVRGFRVRERLAAPSQIRALFRLQVFSLSLHHIKSLDTCMEY